MQNILLISSISQDKGDNTLKDSRIDHIAHNSMKIRKEKKGNIRMLIMSTNTESGENLGLKSLLHRRLKYPKCPKT